MSAFGGMVSLARPVNREALYWERMEQRLLPREPVAARYASASAVLISRGTEPLARWDAVVILDGELSNRRALQAALPDTAADSSDTALVLAAWQRWGRDCALHLEGSFVFGVWQPELRSLFLCRDALGGRTVYFAHRGQRFSFASTLAALLEHPDAEPVVDRAGVYELVLLGPGRTPGSAVFRDIEELEPGQWAVFDATGLSRHGYWSLRDEPMEDGLEVCAQRVRRLVADAVNRQAELGPACAFLSGGLDSSLVCALAGKTLGRLTTFSVDYEDNDLYFQAGGYTPASDRVYAEQMAAFLGSDHNTVVLGIPQLSDALTQAMEARGLPGMADVDASLLLLCQTAQGAGFSAALSGECADELFGGYPWFWAEDLQTFPWADNLALRAGFLQPAFQDWMRPVDYVNSRFQAALDAADVQPDAPADDRRTRQLTVLNLHWFMQTLMTRNDAMSRAAGVKLRTPFADPAIAQYLYTVPWALKTCQGREKGLLRHAFEGVLPENVLWRKKSPYPKTWNPAWHTLVRRLLRRELDSGSCPLLEFLRPQALEDLLAEPGSVPWYGQLMNVPQTIAYFYQMAVWMRRFAVKVV